MRSWREQLDKMAVGLGSTFFVLALACSFGGFDDAAFTDLESHLRAVRARSAQVDAALPGPTDGSAGDDFAALLERPSPFTLPAWATHRRPLILRRMAEMREPLACRHDAPVLARPSVERGAITLRWSPGEGDAHVEITHYSVERAVNPRDVEPVFAALAELPFAGLDYVYTDRDVEPDGGYVYRIVSHARPDLRARTASEGFVFPIGTVEQEARSALVYAPGEVEITLLQVTMEFPDLGMEPERDTAVFGVARWDEAAGAFGRARRVGPLTVGNIERDGPHLIADREGSTGWYPVRIWAVDGTDDLHPIWEYHVEIRHVESGRSRELIAGGER